MRCIADNLARCVAGEAGVVISRYHRIAGVDWIAILLMPYLHAADQADQVPPLADSEANCGRVVATA